MNFESWNVDLDAATAVHACGFKLGVEGDLRNPTGVNPGKFPDGLSPVDQARLLRCGLEAIMNAATSRLQAAKQEILVEKWAKYKPSRPVLSLRKKAN